MTQKDKELLLKDLCARLPHKIKFLRESWNFESDQELSVIESLEDIDKDGYINNTKVYKVEDIKPYLFPLSSMTEEQCHKFYFGFIENEIDYNDFKKYYFDGCLWNKLLTSINDCGDIIDWFNKNHFDYRGLIEKSLALDATGLNIY